MDITKEQFKTYEEIRLSGITNMFMAGAVKRLADEMFGVEMTKDDVIQIMQNYDELKNKYK